MHAKYQAHGLPRGLYDGDPGFIMRWRGADLKVRREKGQSEEHRHGAGKPSFI